MVLFSRLVDVPKPADTEKSAAVVSFGDIVNIPAERTPGKECVIISGVVDTTWYEAVQLPGHIPGALSQRRIEARSIQGTGKAMSRDETIYMAALALNDKNHPPSDAFLNLVSQSLRQLNGFE